MAAAAAAVDGAQLTRKNDNNHSEGMTARSTPILLLLYSPSTDNDALMTRAVGEQQHPAAAALGSIVHGRFHAAGGVRWNPTESEAHHRREEEIPYQTRPYLNIVKQVVYRIMMTENKAALLQLLCVRVQHTSSQEVK